MTRRDDEMTLDEAWAAAEAALPEGWRLMIGNETEPKSGWWATATSPRDPASGWYSIESTTANRRPLDPTPEAALQALTARLQEQPR